MMTFSVEAVGINRGDSLPPSIQQPTPLFPVMEQKPLPLTGGEEAEYLLALKQEFRGAMKSLPCFIQPAAAHKDVERYSDKYHTSEQTDGLTDWTPDWKKFPKELRIHIKKSARHGVSAAARVQSTQNKKRVKDKEEVLLKLEVRWSGPGLLPGPRLLGSLQTSHTVWSRSESRSESRLKPEKQNSQKLCDQSVSSCLTVIPP